MKSLWNERVHTEIVERLRRLTPENPRRWGRMDVGAMLSHLIDAHRLILGEIDAKPIPGLLRRRPVAYVVIHWMRWPRGRVQGPPEAFVSTPEAFEDDRARVIDLVARLVAQDRSAPWPEHPLFGALSVRDWGVFCYRHLDHHLQQFGV